MTRLAVVQSHLEALMKSHLEAEELLVDDDGDVGVRTEKGGYTARVVDRGPEPHIEVFSVVLTDIDLDPGLLEAINDANRRITHSRMFWFDRRVVVAGEIVGSCAEEAGLACLCEEVARTTDRYGDELAGVFGGLTFEARTKESE